MQKQQAANTNQLNGPAKWCYHVLLLLLLAAFSTASYAASVADGDKKLAAQHNSDSAFIVNLPSSAFEVQTEEPELDKAINALPPVFENPPVIATQDAKKRHSQNTTMGLVPGSGTTGSPLTIL